MMRAVLAVFLVLFIYISVFPQEVIKEKVEITPSTILSRGTYNGCSYNFFDSTEVKFLFNSADFNSTEIKPGDTVGFQIWIGYNYIFDEDNYDTLQKSLTIDPNYGKIIKIGSGNYLFIAPENIPNDTLIVTINYGVYIRGCAMAGKINIIDTVVTGKEITEKKSSLIHKTTGTDDCLDCGWYPTFIDHMHGTGQIAIINHKPHINAYFDNAILAAGDTANIIIKYDDGNGNETDYPDTTHFEIGVKDGCGLGQILDANGNTASYFSSIRNPIRFVVADSIEVDSAVVVLRVGAPIINNSVQVATLQRVTQGKTGSGKSNITKIANFVLDKSSKKFKSIANDNYCTNNNYNFENNCFAEAEIRYALEIIYPTKKDKDEIITEEPKMPTVTCIAKLDNYKKGTVTFEWAYCVSYKLKRYDIDDDKFVPLATRDAEIRFMGSSTANNSDTTKWLVPFDTDHAGYIKFKAQQPQRNNKYHRKEYGGDSSKVTTEWTDGYNVFIGGYVFVQVTAKNAAGYIIGFKQDTVNKILGNNPHDANTIYNYAGSNELKAILIHEAKTKQFAVNASNWPQYEKGWPIYGYPNGYGLMQLDNNPAPTENQLWNWKANLDGGKVLFLNLYNKALKKVKKYKNIDMDISEVALINAYQQYNDHKDFYIWNDEEGILEENLQRDNDYGLIVYNKYLNLF